VKLFDETETTADLDQLLREAGLDPADTHVQTVKVVISRYYAKRTADVLERVNEVLAKFAAANDG
jgi:hypothetical protein